MPIVYQRPDGGVSVCVPCVSQDDPNGYTMEQAYARALAKDIPADAINPFRIADGLLPTSDVLRNAWTAVDAQGNVTYDGTVAKSVVDASLQAEMKSYTDELDLTTNLGRDTAAVKAKITDCQARVKQLDALAVAKGSDAATLATLKSLIKGASK